MFLYPTSSAWTGFAAIDLTCSTNPLHASATALVASSSRFCVLDIRTRRRAERGQLHAQEPVTRDQRRLLRTARSVVSKVDPVHDAVHQPRPGIRPPLRYVPKRDIRSQSRPSRQRPWLRASDSSWDLAAGPAGAQQEVC